MINVTIATVASTHNNTSVVDVAFTFSSSAPAASMANEVHITVSLKSTTK
jgi:hypothetical protein